MSPTPCPSSQDQPTVPSPPGLPRSQKPLLSVEPDPDIPSQAQVDGDREKGVIITIFSSYDVG
jgi:hypothetical protein